ncbi:MULTISPECIES: MBL fold metallo-hydrolase [Sporosarcina]|uniref:MBL fold metallo-hydrolase n=1 Tax=Sporosarcina TaxID=1569 RepID=UPI000A16C0E5|nr:MULTISPECIES: MBL fold metallo-hydrolase [Sporosarcina]ARJ37866.1 hypothetical protein SporoP8_02545 [Sporosarcina ureae]
MLEEVANKILRLKVPMPFNMGYTNSYLVEGENGYTIVDTGDNTEEAKALWEKVLCKGMKIEKVVITHAHPDHLGLAGWFQLNYGLPIWLSVKGYEEILKSRKTFDEDYVNPMRSFAIRNGAIHYRDDEAEIEPYYKLDTYQFEPDHIFETGSLLKIGDGLFEAIWTPGHAIDHYCFYERESGTIFVGDHILRSMNPLVTSKHINDNPLQEYMMSLDKVASYKTGIALPGHGKAIVSLPDRVAEMKVHYQKRWRQTFEAIGEEGKTAFDACQLVYKGYSNGKLLPAFMQTITNLIYLESIGQVKRVEHAGKYYYSQVKSFQELYKDRTLQSGIRFK